ncbi:MAG: hypothetical protein HY459_02970 [Parcubacteria group bacterium]|nr:hypothetical protein [Parcubacteria group bacterium]
MVRNPLIASLLILLIILGRILPHQWNVAPVAAAALLAGAILPRIWAIAVPFFGMLVSDFSIGFYEFPVMLSVYVSFIAAAFIGGWVRSFTPHRIVLASLASSTLFFLVTNFAVWATADWYPKTFSGLGLSYLLGLPFFRNTLLGDLLYTGLLFGVWLTVEQGVKKMGARYILKRSFRRKVVF